MKTDWEDVRDFARVLGIMLFLAALLFGFILGVGLYRVAFADNERSGCDTVRGAQTWSIDPSLDPAPWQLGQRDIVFGDAQRRQWLTQVPWGQPSDIYVLPTSGGMWVQNYCSSGQSIIWAPTSASYNYLRQWSVHEFLHHWRLVDHRYWSQQGSGYWQPDTYCDGPEADSYVGIMSYCTTRGNWWGADDQAMLDGIW